MKPCLCWFAGSDYTFNLDVIAHFEDILKAKALYELGPRSAWIDAEFAFLLDPESVVVGLFRNTEALLGIPRHGADTAQTVANPGIKSV